MEEVCNDVVKEGTRKRVREESDEWTGDSPESKLVRVDSVHMVSKSGSDEENQPDLDDESFESAVNSPEVKRIQDDLLDILDDTDGAAIQGLDSVIKSFEEEISVLVSSPAKLPATVEEGESVALPQPDLGFLLEASDDELGLPPATGSGEEEKPDVFLAPDFSGSDGFIEKMGFETGISGYDSFDFGLESVSDGNSLNDAVDFVAFGGLFEYSGENDNEVPGYHWLPETLSGL